LDGENTYGVHRADLPAVLLAHAPMECLRLGTQNASVYFADSFTDTADVVNGADGVHSVVQSAVVDTSRPRPKLR
jgi:salicylate hydroxylase